MLWTSEQWASLVAQSWILWTSELWVSLVAQLVKNLPAMLETWVWSVGWEDPLEKGITTHSSILTWRIPQTVQSMGSQRVGYDWATFTLNIYTLNLYRRSCQLFLGKLEEKNYTSKKKKMLDVGTVALVVGLETKEILRYIKAEIDRTPYRTQRRIISWLQVSSLSLLLNSVRRATGGESASGYVWWTDLVIDNWK